MKSFMEGHSSTIVETSLTELAFIFFFILLVFMGWKFNEHDRLMEEKENSIYELEDDILKTNQVLERAAKEAGISEPFDPKDIVETLKQSQDNFELAREKAEIVNQLIAVIKKAAEGVGIKKESPREIVEALVQDIENTKGQNINLREKIGKIGNGLDHQPCWANPVTGATEYVFNAIINEDNIEIQPGWPASREAVALSDPHIQSVIGTYPSNKLFWQGSNDLYQDSVEGNCRHFVRVFDHAMSKKSFKFFLSGIENHYYKYLSRERYE